MCWAITEEKVSVFFHFRTIKSANAFNVRTIHLKWNLSVGVLVTLDGKCYRRTVNGLCLCAIGFIQSATSLSRIVFVNVLLSCAFIWMLELFSFCWLENGGSVLNDSSSSLAACSTLSFCIRAHLGVLWHHLHGRELHRERVAPLRPLSVLHAGDCDSMAQRQSHLWEGMVCYLHWGSVRQSVLSLACPSQH